ncbi:zinc metalloprotease HtpX [Thermincola potens]|uniref:Protease HtpX homolog n=1 Tax=Thermincola potens (strain JR) TaxID=635013 RepID=D5XBB1_THEPJ|nr:zinc metalloprotease HtpX [Thermincola potens]ADG81431.1 peptidase M48 Ste24p [Thermincola potens JR]
MSGFGNQLKTVVLMSILTVLVILVGSALGGRQGMVVAFVFALLMNGASYWFSDKIVIKMTGSQPLTRNDNPELYDMVERLASKAGLPMPKLYLTPSPQPNAFATGRNPAHAAVAVTEGILRLLNREELEGVIAHELAHIKNRDILIGTLAAVMAGVITTLADWAQWALIFGGGNSDDEEGSGLAALPMIILAPLAAMLVQMAVSRSREYLADATGARIAGSSNGLANALLKLEQGARMIPMEVNSAASHMFIVNPLSAQRLLHLFSTHPPIADRVRRLRNMGL